MPQPVNAQDPIAIARLQELLSPASAWSRSLWNIGLVLGLAELHEACIAARDGALGDGAVQNLISSLHRQCGKDPTLSPLEKAHVRAQLKGTVQAYGTTHHALEQFRQHLAEDYISRWATVVAATPDYSLERFSRSVAAHLLDAGFSNHYLHTFIKTLWQQNPAITVPELCEALHATVTGSPRREFRVLLAFKLAPQTGGGTSGWLNPQGVSQWLQTNHFAADDIDASRGFELTVKARDVFGAGLVAQREANRFAARYAIANGKPLELLPMLWVQGAAEPHQLLVESRGVQVRALYRGDLIFADPVAKDIDAAIEILSHLDHSSPAAAIAGGWGAIEAVLGDRGNRSAAADNLASLVACSFPRQELTKLSYTKNPPGPLAFALASCGWNQNRERSRVMAQLIQNNQVPELHSLADRAAVMRMQQLLHAPNKEIAGIKETVGDAFHRLYRQRNMILHAGKLDSVVLTASLRTVAKLAGAGMDRVVHGQHVQSLRPLELVARANLRMTLIHEGNALTCVDLLEHP